MSGVIRGGYPQETVAFVPEYVHIRRRLTMMRTEEPVDKDNSGLEIVP
ncbi:unnamed protein product, partial [marine sediment metagenome]